MAHLLQELKNTIGNGPFGIISEYEETLPVLAELSDFMNKMSKGEDKAPARIRVPGHFDEPWCKFKTRQNSAPRAAIALSSSYCHINGQTPPVNHVPYKSRSVQYRCDGCGSLVYPHCNTDDFRWSMARYVACEDSCWEDYDEIHNDTDNRYKEVDGCLRWMVLGTSTPQTEAVSTSLPLFYKLAATDPKLVIAMAKYLRSKHFLPFEWTGNL